MLRKAGRVNSARFFCGVAMSKIHECRIFPIFSRVWGRSRQSGNDSEGHPYLSKGHLLVFPELALSGYQFLSKEEVRELAEDIPSGSDYQRLEEAIRGRALHVVVGLAERDHDRLYNSAVLIGPNGYIGTYRKTHLFSEETLWFAPGDTGFLVWDIGKAKVGLLVCFDWFFPEAARSLALKGADILCHPSNLVLPYCPDAMVTRCLENRVFAITANRVGREQRGEKSALSFIGMSEIVAPNGQILYRSSQKDPELL